MMTPMRVSLNPFIIMLPLCEGVKRLAFQCEKGIEKPSVRKAK